jgi:hypothetical protein
VKRIKQVTAPKQLRAFFPADFRLRRTGDRPGDLLFHLMSLPAAHFLSGKDVSVIAAIARIMAIECGFENLLAYPSLF